MNRRITIGLLVVLAALGGYIWYMFGRPDAPPVTPVTPQPTPIAFLNFNDSQATALQVQDVKTKQLTRVVRDGAGWKMEQPAQGPANAPPVENLLFDLAHLNADRKIESPGDLAEYGLNPPAYEITLTLQDGSTRAFQMGNQNPDKNFWYVMQSGDAAVYLIRSTVGDDIQSFITQPPYTPTPLPTDTVTPTPLPGATPTP
jgi:hypothetical protein